MTTTSDKPSAEIVSMCRARSVTEAIGDDNRGAYAPQADIVKLIDELREEAMTGRLRYLAVALVLDRQRPAGYCRLVNYAGDMNVQSPNIAYAVESAVQKLLAEIRTDLF